MFIGLTGGIGSGKSTVAHLLADRGAVVIDADAIAHEVLGPGGPGVAAVAAAFPGVVVDGVVDRAALAAVVFTDPDALDRLEGITHPLIRARTAELVAAAGKGAVVVHDIPLLVELGSEDAYDLVVVVAADEAVRRDRLARERGMSPEEMDARIGSQASDEARRAVADVWIDNSGDEEALRRAVTTLWEDVIGPARDRVGGPA